MKLDDFIEKYKGKGIDFDNAFSTQCVDLYRQYVKEVLGYPQSPPVAGAKDIWDTYLPEYYKRIENTPYGVPEKGDIVIFGTTLGKYGHVSIFVEGTASKFISYDQNYPSGSLCHLQGHTYNGVIGWLRPIQKQMELPQWFTTLLQENGLSLDREGEFRAFFEKAKKYDDDTKALKEQVVSANEALADRAREVSMLTESNQKLTDKAEEMENLYNEKRSECDKEVWEKEKLEIKVKSQEEEITDLNKKIKEINGEIEPSPGLVGRILRALFGRR